MANPNSKLHATQNPSSVFLITFISFLMLMTKAKSESFSFSLPSFEPGASNILTGGDANTTGGVLQLTKKDLLGNPTEHSVGLSAFASTVHLSDTKTGRVADFFTEFTFVVKTNGSSVHADGFTFFISSLYFGFPDDSSGGFLGLFNDKTAFNTSLNQVVAVEFDSFANQWDPNYPHFDSPHIGIDINSIRSVATAPWAIDIQPQGSIGRAVISYKSSSKILSVSVDYPNSPVKSNATVLSYPVNFGALLSEYVLIGFSGATGDLVETHDILSWSFGSVL